VPDRGERVAEQPDESSKASGVWRRRLRGLNAVSRHPIVSSVVAAAVLAAAGAVLANVFKGEARDPEQPPAVLTDLDLEVVRDPDLVGMHRGEPYFYWVPTDVRDGAPPPDRCRDRHNWAYQQGGADADVVWAKLTLENGRDTEVSIDDLQVEVVENIPTPGGSVAACPVGGASSEAYGLIVDLTTDPATLQFRENQRADSGPVPRFELKPGEQDAFVIYATAPPDRLISWRLVADVKSQGTTTPLILQDGDRPMRIAGTSGLPMFTWTGSSWDPWPS
jgi:hypothetical protein